jgi:hypothetical protein
MKIKSVPSGSWNSLWKRVVRLIRRNRLESALAKVGLFTPDAEALLAALTKEFPVEASTIRSMTPFRPDKTKRTWRKSECIVIGGI